MTEHSSDVPDRRGDFRPLFLGDMTRVLIDGLQDEPIHPPSGPLAQRRRQLRRQRRRSAREEEELARLDDKANRDLATAIARRRHAIEQAEVDRVVWSEWLRPQLRAVIAERGQDLPEIQQECNKLLRGLPVLETFCEGFGVWWLALQNPFRPPGTPQHGALTRALSILEKAGVVGDNLARFMASVYATRYPVEYAFAEWVQEMVTKVRRRGVPARIRAVVRRIQELRLEFSTAYHQRTVLETRRMDVARSFLAVLGPRAARSKNETRRRAVVALVGDLVSRNLTIHDACRVVGAFLDEPDTTIHTLYYRSRHRSPR